MKRERHALHRQQRQWPNESAEWLHAGQESKISSRLNDPQKAGLTLIEAIVAFGILGFAIFVIMGMLVSSRMAISSSEDIRLATQIAREKVAEWTEEGYPWVISRPSSVSGKTSVESQQNAVVKQTEFSWTAAHGPVVSGGVEQIVVTVSWAQKGEGSTHTSSVQLSTWVTQ